MSELDEVITAVCRLASDHAIGRMSTYDLVARSRYRRHWTEVTVERLAACLAEHPDWLEAWLTYSEDKRTSSGWYVAGREGDDVRVGYFPESPDRPTIRFDDRVQACAEFVHREMLSVTGLDNHGSRLWRLFARILSW